MLEKIYSHLTFDPKKVFLLLITIVFYKITFIIFALFQNPVVFQHTLGKITHTYVRDTLVKENVWQVKSPYYYKNQKNLLSWDAGIYNDIRYRYYSDKDQTYAFFPLYPMLWKFLNVDIEYMAFFNYLLFGLAILILSSLFLTGKKTTDTETIIVFLLAITLPIVVVFYLPYAEAVYTLTFSLAVWGWFKNKYWFYFIFMALFAASRPIFINAGLAFIIADILLFIKHKNFPLFLKEATLKILPIIFGTCMVFYIFYLNSGSFFKYFETIERLWHIQFKIPSRLTDWSVEGFGMNVFTIFFVIFLSAIVFINSFIQGLKNKNQNITPEELKHNSEYKREYFFNVSILYFLGLFATIIFFQNGSLNGLCRYVIASPFFYIFLFSLYCNYNQLNSKKILLFFIPASILSFLMLIGFEKCEPALNFSDSGYFTFLLSFTYLFFMKSMGSFWRLFFLILVIAYNLLWITYLYNMYLCNAWIYT